MVLLSGAAIVGLAAHSPAQCTTAWSSPLGVPGTDQLVHVIAPWDPDGAGPATPLLVVGGEFVVAGTLVASRVATYDPASGNWGTLGAGVNGAVYAIAVLPNGELVVGGQFTAAGGQPANNLARWNGSAWSALGAGTDQRVQALAALPNGDVVAGGLFATAGGLPANHLARWDGATWSPLSTGTDRPVHALAVLPNGDLLAGGQFTTAGGGSASRVARWDGASWFPVGAGLGAVVRSFAFFPNGDLLAGTEDIGSPFRWDGSSWSELGAPGAAANGTVLAVAVLANGDVIAGGTFWGMGGVTSMRGLARWNGTAWSPFGTGLPNGSVHAFTVLASGDVVVGGQIGVAGGKVARNLARWDGTQWSALGGGVGFARTMAVMLDGSVVIGARLSVPGAADIPTPARWDGSQWSALGGGYGPNSDDVVGALLAMPNGDLIAAGTSPAGGSSLVRRIARWDGQTWSTIGTPDRSVKAMVAMPNGDLIVGGQFTSIDAVPAMGVARWDGSVWSPLGAGISSASGTQGGDVRALALMPNGDLIAGGSFSRAGAAPALNIAQWDGTAWSSLGSGLGNFVNALTVLPSGRLVAGGGFGNAGTVVASRVAQWDGTAWSPLGSGLSVPLNGFQDRVWSLATLPDGTLVAGGEFADAGGLPANGIARWNGNAWSAIGSGLNGAPEAFGVLPDGRLAMAGTFAIAGGAAAGNVALVTPTCPATAVPSGVGCAGSGGPMVLEATALPWLGGTFRSLCSGMAANSLAASLIGLGPQNTPLSALHPAAGATCQWLASADAATLLLPFAGLARQQFALPANPGLVGVTLYHQVLQVEIGQGGALTWLGGSNALVLTTGTY